jgi:hypothetical protein
MFLCVVILGLAMPAVAAPNECSKFSVNLNWRGRSTEVEMTQARQILQAWPGFNVVSMSEDGLILFVEQDCANLSPVEAMNATSDLAQELESMTGVTLSVGPEVPYPARENR